MSAAHRAGVLELHGGACYFRPGIRGNDYGPCHGRIQGAHWISEQTIKRKRDQAIVNRQIGKDANVLLLEVELEELLEDPRNGVPACVHHHDTFDLRNGQALEPAPEPPFQVHCFAADYGLEGELE